MIVSRETPSGIASVSRETAERLEVFARLVVMWNSRINLVSRSDEASIWSRHVEDSLQLLPLIPDGIFSALDIGTGAGFPGLVLAIATGIPYILVEADARKAAFLVEAARLTATPARVVNARIEHASLPPTPLITARAVAPLSKLLSWATPHLSDGGTLLLLKGVSADQEIADAASAWTMHIDRRISSTGNGAVLRITGIAPA